MELETFDDVKKSMQKNSSRPFHLLLGNGFSMAYDKEIFSYNALYTFIETLDDDLIKKVFDAVKTKNFELVMQQLDTLGALVDALGEYEELKQKVSDAALQLKHSLLDAVNKLHPEHVFTIPDHKLQPCAQFLKVFLEHRGNIFTTNYDLLLYWVLMRCQSILKASDGFGRDRESPDEYVSESDLEYSELRWGKYKDEQVIFYLHGALPIFDDGIEVVKEQYTTENYLLGNINNRINKGSYPIFVTAGNGNEKLNHIMHNKYLSYCYEKLSRISGSLVTFGFNFGEYDHHIISAINEAASQSLDKKLWSIYIGVYSKENYEYIETLKSKFKCKLHIFDAKTAKVWG